MVNPNADETQQALCSRFGAQFCVSPEMHKMGIAWNVRSTLIPINGMRHPPTKDVTGWYIWAGEHLSEADDFFVPLHVSHLDEWRVGLTKYLGLAPGWRFLIAPGHEDVWFDEKLLHV